MAAATAAAAGQIIRRGGGAVCRCGTRCWSLPGRSSTWWRSRARSRSWWPRTPATRRPAGGGTSGCGPWPRTCSSATATPGNANWRTGRRARTWPSARSACTRAVPGWTWPGSGSPTAPRPWWIRRTRTTTSPRNSGPANRSRPSPPSSRSGGRPSRSWSCIPGSAGCSTAPSTCPWTWACRCPSSATRSGRCWAALTGCPWTAGRSCMSPRTGPGAWTAGAAIRTPRWPPNRASARRVIC